jgi:hypothetical protein|nr:MAG TPA: hypothetical protein [Caudoviricetes sp.]
MPIVIKEIHVLTIVENKVVQRTDVSNEVLDKIKEDIIIELQGQQQDSGRKKNER